MQSFAHRIPGRTIDVADTATRRICRRIRNLPGLFLVLFACIVISSPAGAAPQYAALVLDAQTGRIVHAENIETRVHPASLTKIMTLYMVFDALREGRLTMDQEIPISAQAASMPPSKIGLSPGQTIRVEDAIMVLVTKSANDIAVAVAEALAGSEAEFARRMTTLAQQSLDMPSTVFTNASGLPDSRQITTARDMVNLAIRMRAHFPQYYPLFATRSFTYRGVTYRNHNGLLREYIGMDGIKTGFINASGFNLVASAERDGRRVHGVIFGGSSAQSRNDRMATLLDQGFTRLGAVPAQPAFAPAGRGSAPTIATLVAATAPTPAHTVTASAARPSFAPAFRSENPTIADLISASQDRVADYPVIRFAQLLAYVGADHPRPSPRTTSALQSDPGTSVPVPILMAAFDPAKSAAAGIPSAAEPACAGGWSVQIGTFPAQDIARAVAQTARQQDRLAGTTALVDQTADGDRTLYRALLVGLPDAPAAQAACSALQQAGIGCTATAQTDGHAQPTCS